MAKVSSKAKKSSFVPMMIGLLAVGALAWYMTNPDNSAKAASKSSAAKPKPKSASDALYTKEDYVAHFAVYEKPAVDAFKPLVAKSSTSNLPDPQHGGIPADLAGGDPNWYFTGMVAINGKPQALFENATSQASDYVPVGEHWKTCAVRAVSDTDVVLVGTDGSHTTVKMGNKAVEAKQPEAPATLPPVAGLQGPIGPGQFQISPLTADQQPTDTQNTGGGRRRGRGNRGGFGG